MAAMNWKNNRRKNEASRHRNNDNPTRNEEKNNTHNTHGREETYMMTTTQGPPIYSGPFSEFIMLMVLQENFQLPMMLKPYDETRDPYIHVTMFKSMMLVNEASDSFLCWTFPTFWIDLQLCQAFISLCEQILLEPSL